jgi:hypothetical protein
MFCIQMTPHLPKNRVVYDKIWKNVVKSDRPHDNITRRTHFACLITKAADTHSEYVILIAFSRRQWLRKHAPMLRYSTLPLLINYHPSTMT